MAAKIAKCFCHRGFDVSSVEVMGDPGRHAVISANVLGVLRDTSFTNYVDTDSSALVCGVPTDENDKETTARPSRVA